MLIIFKAVFSVDPYDSESSKMLIKWIYQFGMNLLIFLSSVGEKIGTGDL